MTHLSRREFGKLAGYFGTLALAGYVGLRRHEALPLCPIGLCEAGENDLGWRVLNRMAFGPCPGDLERLRETGVDAFIEEQLAPELLDENPVLQAQLSSLETLDLEPAEARDFELAQRGDDIVGPALRTLLQLPNPALDSGPGQTSRELQQATILRATYSRRQLLEVMVEFWTDHFNIDQGKGDCAWLKTIDDRVIRQHALGKFRDLVMASAQSPAMLHYLDNTLNVCSEAGGSNENYARELLELHTLGVGNYSLGDVQEVARCFTGWGVSRGVRSWGEWEFRRDSHDEGPKVVLGGLIASGQGTGDALEVLDRLCRHPNTAIHIARKLCRRFIADVEPPDLIDQLARVFIRTEGDIRQLLSTLFRSPHFRYGAGVKLKRPFHFVVSALRGLWVETSGAGLLPHLEALGQLPFRHPTPDGYPDRVNAWTQGLTARWNFAVCLVDGQVKDTHIPTQQLLQAIGHSSPHQVVQALARVLLGRTLPERYVAEIAGQAENAGLERACSVWIALLLSAPQFQWR